MDIPALPTANSFCSQLYIYTHTHTSQEPDTSLKNVLKTSNALSQLITFESFNVNNSMCLFCRFFIKVHRPILKKKKDIWGSNNPEVKKILIRKKCFLHKDNISILAKRKCLFSRKKKESKVCPYSTHFICCELCWIMSIHLTTFSHLTYHTKRFKILLESLCHFIY